MKGPGETLIDRVTASPVWGCRGGEVAGSLERNQWQKAALMDAMTMAWDIRTAPGENRQLTLGKSPVPILISHWGSPSLESTKRQSWKNADGRSTETGMRGSPKRVKQE